MKKSLSLTLISILAVAIIVLGILFISSNNNKTQQIEALTNENKAQAVQIESLNADAEDRDLLLEYLNADVADKAEQIAGLKTDVDDQAKQIADLNADVANKTEQIKDLKTDVADKTTQIEGLNADVASKTEQIENLKTDITNKDAQIETLVANAADKDADIADKASQIETLTANAGDSAGQIEALTADASAKAVQIEALTADVAAKDADIADKTSQIETLTANAGANAGQIEALTADVSAKAVRIEVLTADAAAKDADIANKAAQIEALTADSADKAAQIEVLTADAADKVAQIEALTADVAAKEAEIADKAAQIETLLSAPVEQVTEVVEEAVAETALMTYADYAAAELDSPVVIQCYVQAHQSWWDNKITVYAADKDGAYFIYELACSEEDAAKLIPGTLIEVTGFKGEWAGEVEIIDATFTFVNGEAFVAEALDVTDKLCTNELVKFQNQFVSFNGLTVAAYNENGDAFAYQDGKGGHDGNADIYFKVAKDDAVFEFCIESYLTDNTTDVYAAVENLKVGDVVDLQGFLYWYNGANPHITSVTLVSQNDSIDADILPNIINDIEGTYGDVPFCGAFATDTIKIAIPNDAIHEGCALLLLQANGVITLDDAAGITATMKDIKDNPLNIEFVEIEGDMVPNALIDVDFGIISSNYAMAAGLNAALLYENAESPYVNVVCVNSGNEDTPEAKALVAAVLSQRVADFFSMYAGSVISVVENPTDGFDPAIDYKALAGETIRVVCTRDPHSHVMEIVKEILAEKDITLEYIIVDDYVTPNTMVDRGDAFTNFFAHTPYQDDFNAQNGTNLVTIAGVHVEHPMGLYAGKSADLGILGITK